MTPELVGTLIRRESSLGGRWEKQVLYKGEIDCQMCAELLLLI